MQKNSRLRIMFYKDHRFPVVSYLDEEKWKAGVFYFHDIPMWLYFWNCLQDFESWADDKCVVFYLPQEASEGIQLLFEFLEKRKEAHLTPELFSLIKDKKWDELADTLAVRKLAKRIDVENEES